jgi:phage-related minor tail protein
MVAKSAVVEIQVKADASDAVKDVGKAEHALKDLEKAAHEAGSGASGIAELTDAVAQLAKATEGAAEGAGGLSASFEAGLAGGGIGAAISGLAGGVKEAFSKLAEVGADAFGKAMEFDVGRDKLQAQLGLNAEQAKQMGQLAGDLYSQAYGESIGQVNEALRLVTLNVGLSADTQAADLQAVTASVLDLASAFDQDLGGVTRAVGQLIKTGLAKNAKEAMDVLTRGFQIGNDKAEDLLDTVNEYSTSFRDVGLDAKQFMGILKQGLEGGARDADKVADAIKEFGIRSKDASATSADAFKSLGLNAKEMTALFARGGAEAAGGLDLVLDKLREMTDPVEKNRIAVELFGTQSEDLGKALDSIDPSKAVDALGQVGGAADKMGHDLADNASTRFESWKRTVETNVITFLANNVLPALDTLGGKAQEVFTKMSRAWEAFQLGFTGVPPLQLEVDDGKLTSSITAIENMDPTKGNPVLRSLQEMGAELRKISDEYIPKLKDAIKDLNDRLAELNQFLKDNKETMELLRVLGVIALIGALLILIAVLVGVITTVGLVIVTLALLLGPIAAVIFAAQRLGFNWGLIWGLIVLQVNTAKTLISETLGGISDAVKGMIRTIQGLLSGDWSQAWNGALETLRGVTRFMNAAINTVIDLVKNLLELIGRLRGEQQIAKGFGIVPRTVVNSAGVTPAAVGVSQMATAGSTSVVYNVTVSHTGLGIDSPTLQRDIVGAIRRYERRNGPR